MANSMTYSPRMSLVSAAIETSDIIYPTEYIDSIKQNIDQLNRHISEGGRYLSGLSINSNYIGSIENIVLAPNYRYNTLFGEPMTTTSSVWDSISVSLFCNISAINTLNTLIASRCLLDFSLRDIALGIAFNMPRVNPVAITARDNITNTTGLTILDIEVVVINMLPITHEDIEARTIYTRGYRDICD